MGWKTGWFGSEDPSRGRVIGTAATLVAVASVFAGMFVDFIPAPDVMPVWQVFLGVGFAATMYFIHFAWRRDRLRVALEQLGWIKA